MRSILLSVSQDWCKSNSHPLMIVNPIIDLTLQKTTSAFNTSLLGAMELNSEPPGSKRNTLTTIPQLAQLGHHSTLCSSRLLGMFCCAWAMWYAMWLFWVSVKCSYVISLEWVQCLNCTVHTWEVKRQRCTLLSTFSLRCKWTAKSCPELLSLLYCVMSLFSCCLGL